MPTDKVPNKTTLPLRLRDDMLFADFNGREGLIDSGSPVTIGYGVPLEILGHRFHLNPALTERVLGELNEQKLIRPVELLVGTDVMHTFDLLFDLPGGELTISIDSLKLEGDVVQVDPFGGVPKVALDLGPHRFTAFIDTGANRSFTPDHAFPIGGVMETVDEYSPLIGHFRTLATSADARLGTLTQSLTFCRTTDTVLERFDALGATGLIGNELFRDRKVLYAIRRGSVVFGERRKPDEHDSNDPDGLDGWLGPQDMGDQDGVAWNQ